MKYEVRDNVSYAVYGTFIDKGYADKYKKELADNGLMAHIVQIYTTSPMQLPPLKPSPQSVSISLQTKTILTPSGIESHKIYDLYHWAGGLEKGYVTGQQAQEALFNNPNLYAIEITTSKPNDNIYSKLDQLKQSAFHNRARLKLNWQFDTDSYGCTVTLPDGTELHGEARFPTESIEKCLQEFNDYVRKNTGV